mgnify:CR=1 FL=1
MGRDGINSRVLLFFCFLFFWGQGGVFSVQDGMIKTELIIVAAFIRQESPKVVKFLLL